MNQQFLDNLMNNNSSFFLDNVESWCSHRPLLQIALELTKDSQSPILELGTGYGSTEQLHKYVQNNNLTLNLPLFFLNQLLIILKILY